MIDLINININKRLSILSLIFIFISLVMISFLFYYHAAFEISDFELLNNKTLIVQNYYQDCFQTLEVIGVFFVIFLVALELFYNINNFDAYFISLSSKKEYLISKIISYLLIIATYFIVVFLIFITIYYIRFNELNELDIMLKISSDYLAYFIFIFLISYVVLLLFQNYFSSILLFISYWLIKMIEEENIIKKYVFLDVKFDIENKKIIYSFEKTYLMFYLIMLVLMCLFVYKKKDLKINS